MAGTDHLVQGPKPSSFGGAAPSPSLGGDAIVVTGTLYQEVFENEAKLVFKSQNVSCLAIVGWF